MPPKIHLFDPVFMFAVIVVGLITTYEDIQTSRIKNEWVIAGLSYSFLVYSLIWTVYQMSAIKIFPDTWGSNVFYLVMNLDKWAINLAVSAVVAYLLWVLKIWGAGDAKLFICYAGLIPVSQYSRVYFDGYFVSFQLLMAIFIPATVFLFLRTAVYFLKRFDPVKIKVLVVSFIKVKMVKVELIRAGKVMLGFFILFFSFRVLAGLLSGPFSKLIPNQDIILAVSLFAFRQLARFFRRHADIMVGVFIVLIAYIIFRVSCMQERFVLGISSVVKNIIFLMMLVPLFRKAIDLYAERTEQKTAPFAPWMFLGALLVWFI